MSEDKLTLLNVFGHGIASDYAIIKDHVSNCFLQQKPVYFKVKRSKSLICVDFTLQEKKDESCE
jgi:aminoglycoside phosphotransferase family enzyme